MTSEELRTAKTILINLVNIHKGLKYRAVFTKLLEEDINLTTNDILQVVHELVQEQRLSRIEYMIPESSEIHSFYLPYGTRIL